MNKNPIKKIMAIAAIAAWICAPQLLAQEASDQPYQLSATQVMEMALKARSENKVPEALKLLADELDKRGGDSGYFKNLSDTIWREAQVKSGRLDPDWAALQYDEIFKSSVRNRRYNEMNDVTGNLLATLRAAGRHGRLTEVLDWWLEKQNGNQRLEIRTYQDQGAVYPFFPEIRKRNVPITVLHSRIGVDAQHEANLVDIEQKNGHVLGIHADQLESSGKWRESMEWVQQVRHWASLEDGKPRWQMIQPWFESVDSSARSLWWLGFTEEALREVDTGLAAPMQNSYHGRCNITFSLLRLEILMDLKQAPDDLVNQAEELVKRAESNTHLSIFAHRNARVTLARALLHVGKEDEALALLDELSAIGHVSARNERVKYRIEHKMLDGVEEELLALLKQSRHAGNKMSELWLYKQYAEFLELSNRLTEALAIRREVVRLCRTFDLITDLPIQLAKLALLLERMGDLEGSKAAAEEAQKGIAAANFPSRRKSQAAELLAKLSANQIAGQEKSEKTPKVDFQPERAIVIPIEGAPWTSFLTLANPSDTVVDGTLSFKGMPMSFIQDKETGDVIVSPANPSVPGDATLRLKLEPSNFRLVKIKADATFAKKGDLSLIWTSWNGEQKVETNIVIESPEKGVSSSVIQAGNYRANPFYGVPVYLHYVTKNEKTTSSPLRFLTSETARVEVYGLDDTPLSVDAQGNGSLRDKGDELFGASDGEGNVLLPIKDGGASFMLLIYPQGPLPKDGLTLNVEAFQNGTWTLHSQNRLQP